MFPNEGTAHNFATRYSRRECCQHSRWLSGLPESDVLEFDYVSTKRPNLDSRMLDTETFDSVLISLQSTACSEIDQLAALRNVSNLMFISSLQFRQLMGIYKDIVPRTELFILFFFRIADIYNEK